jgi:Putative sensor
MTEISIDRAPGRLAPIPRPAVMARDFAYLVLGLPLGIASFTIAVTGLSLSLGLLITLAGIPVLVATLLALRAFAAAERMRAAWLLGTPVAGSERRLTGSAWQRTKAIASDPASWRDTLYALVLLPVGIFGFTVAVTLWSIVIGFITSPAWYWAVPSDDDTIPLLDSTSLGYSVLRVLIGLALLPTTAVACRALAAGTGTLARALLR